MTTRMIRACFVLLVMLTALSVSAFADENDSWYTLPETQTVPILQEQPSQPVQQQIVFPDVQPKDWFYDDVMKLHTIGVIGGFPDGTFRPNDKVTTGQALKMILLAAGHPEPVSAASHWARGYLDYAIERNFLVRFKDISDLDIPMSRALTAKLAANALGISRTDKSKKFTDTDDDYVCALSEIGIIGGYPDGSFKPKNSLTRAELSAICSRIYTYLKPVTAPAPNETTDEEEEPIILRTSEQGVQFIKDREGFVKNAMWDYAQYSIGYGSRCDKDEYPDGITEEQADRLLRKNIVKFEQSVDAFLEKYNIDLSTYQYDAIISFAYNLGTSWFTNGASSSKLAGYLISGNYTENEIAAAFGIWCHVTSNGQAKILDSLVTRRILETQMFLYGDYGKNANSFCSVIYETEKGSREMDISLYKKGETYGKLCSCTSKDDEFMGWFTADGTQITEDTVVSQNLKVFAKWRGSIVSDPIEPSEYEDPDPFAEDQDDTPIFLPLPGSWY